MIWNSSFIGTFETLKFDGVLKLLKDNEKNENFIILDVRTFIERVQKSLPSSLHIDFYSPDFESKIEELDRKKIYLVHCASGGRSESVCNYMSKVGFKKLYNFLGSLEELQNAGIKLLFENKIDE